MKSINFSAMTCDQLEKMYKKLESFKREFIKQYNTVLCVINDERLNEKIEQINTELENAFNDEIKKSNAAWTNHMNRVQSILWKSL